MAELDKQLRRIQNVGEDYASHAPDAPTRKPPSLRERGGHRQEGRTDGEAGVPVRRHRP